MARLTLDQVAREAGSSGSGGRDAATSLHLSHRALSDVSCLSTFKNLERLDLGYNCLVTLEGLSSCVNLKWLSVIENKLESLKGVEGLSKLQVLNAGKNKLTKMDEVKYLGSLGALILNDNNIYSICKLDQLRHLNTLVLSRNPVITIGDALAKAKSMTKLSLSHCQIENIGSSLVACVGLKELRLAHNKIMTIPPELAKNSKLLNLDLGSNLIERWSDLKVLSELHYLRNLNLQGNPIAEKDSLAKKVKKLVPALRIFNAKPIEAGSKNEKISRKQNLSGKDNPSHNDSSEFNTENKGKVRRSKQHLKCSAEPAGEDPPSDVTVAAPSKSKLLDGGTKRKKENPAMELGRNSEAKRMHEKSSLDETERKAKKEAKRKKSADKEEDGKGIDDTETSFVDLIFSEKDSQVAELQGKSQELVPDAKFTGGLVIDHTKKRKRRKDAVTGSSALQLLSSVPEVGSGRLSGWD